MIPTVLDDGSTDNPLEQFIPDDAWVAYHGTSSVYASSIESTGLNANTDSAPWTAEQCRRVGAVFDRLAWQGTGDVRTGNAYATLSVYTLAHDVDRGGRRNLYLAENFARAALYAGKPGGETVRALIRCLEELQRFEDEIELRSQHLASLSRELRTIGYDLDASYNLKRPPLSRHPLFDRKLEAVESSKDVGRLATENASLRPLLARLLDISHQHRPVVYAIALDPALLRGACMSNMGLEIAIPIPTDRILAKACPALQRPDHGTTSWPSEEFRLYELWEARVNEINHQK